MATTYCFCSWQGDADDYEKHVKDAHGGNVAAPMMAPQPAAAAEDDDKPKASDRK